MIIGATHRRTAARRAATASLAAVCGALLSACVLLPGDVDEPDMPCGAIAVAPLPACSEPVLDVDLATVVASQTQAVPDFDATRILVDDPVELDRLEAILDPTHPVVAASGCPGGRTTVLEIEPVDAPAFTLTTDMCSGDGTAEAIDALVVEWRESGDFAPAP